MKNTINILFLSLVVVSGLLFVNCDNNTTTESAAKPMSTAERKAQMAEEKKKWEALPDGIMYKKWQTSPEGQKVRASHDKIRKYITTFTDMEAVVTSVTFQRENTKSSGPKWLIVRIDGEEYMMQFIPKDFEQLKSLKVNDKIIVKSRSAGYSHNHPYLIISGDYIAQNNKILFKRDFSKNKGC